MWNGLTPARADLPLVCEYTILVAYLHPDKLTGIRATVVPAPKKKPRPVKATAGPGLLATIAKHIYEGQTNGS